MILADSGYYQAEYFDDIETSDIDFIVAASRLRTLQSETYNLNEWKDLGDGIAVAYFNFKHKKESWKKPLVIPGG